jgi:hypothetical protein
MNLRERRKRTVQTTFLASLAIFGGYALYLTRARPAVPDITLGEIYPMPAHGPPVYISGVDLLILSAAGGLAVLTFFIATVLRNRGTW